MIKNTSAGKRTAPLARFGVIAALLVAAWSVQAEHLWWNFDPLLEDAQDRLYRVKGVQDVKFYQYADGAFYPYLGVSMHEFSMAQQRHVCEIVWKRYNISAVFEYANYITDGDGWNRLDCADIYPELRPRLL